MNVLVSRASRRLVLRLDRGDSLHEALARVAQEHAVTAGAVTGTGVVEEVGLTVFDAARGRFAAPRALDGAFELVSLDGNVALHEGLPLATLHGTLARATDNGLQVVAGRIAAARIVHAELVLWCFDDVALERVGDPVEGLAPWGPGAVSSTPSAAPSAPSRSTKPIVETLRSSEPLRATPPVSIRESAASANESSRRDTHPAPPRAEPARAPAAAAPAAAPGGGLRSLADVAKALESMPDRNDEIEDKLTRPEPEPGDVFDHPSYGLVEYVGDSSTGHARIRRANGSIKEISLDIFDVVAVAPKGGKRAWALRTFKR